jgi:CDP-glucose 4,6-dehydratase
VGQRESALENMAMTPDFWSGKKVFVTGHTGFKGSWLCLWLQHLGADVTGYALTPPTTPALFDVAQVACGMQSIISDVRDSAALTAAIQSAAPEIIIHMAAQPLVRYSYVEPVETYSTNVMGAVNLLEAVRHEPNVRAVINVTSDKCYENDGRERGYNESDAMGGHDPYSSSKGCAELVTSAYRHSFFNTARYTEHRVGLASARAGNVIGGGDWAADRLIPDILRALSHNQPVMIRNPHAIRPWQHVLEPLSGYLLLAQKLYEDGAAFAEGWNFGPLDDDAKPVQWIVEQMTQRWDDDAKWQRDNNAHPHEAHYLKLDCKKSQTRLEWHPVWNLSVALDEIIAWHKSYLAGMDMRAVSLQQIEKFMQAAPRHYTGAK